MSGGSIGEYGYYGLEEVVTAINAETCRVAFEGSSSEVYAYHPTTKQRMGQVADLLEVAAQAWKDVDLLASGDTSEDTWLSSDVEKMLDLMRE